MSYIDADQILAVPLIQPFSHTFPSKSLAIDAQSFVAAARYHVQTKNMPELDFADLETTEKVKILKSEKQPPTRTKLQSPPSMIEELMIISLLGNQDRNDSVGQFTIFENSSQYSVVNNSLQTKFVEIVRKPLNELTNLTKMYCLGNSPMFPDTDSCTQFKELVLQFTTDVENSNIFIPAKLPITTQVHA